MKVNMFLVADRRLGLEDQITAFWQCMKSMNSLVYQIRKPFPPVHLVNIGPLAFGKTRLTSVTVPNTAFGGQDGIRL